MDMDLGNYGQQMKMTVKHLTYDEYYFLQDYIQKLYERTGTVFVNDIVKWLSDNVGCKVKIDDDWLFCGWSWLSIADITEKLYLIYSATTNTLSCLVPINYVATKDMTEDERIEAKKNSWRTRYREELRAEEEAKKCTSHAQ